MHINTLKLSFKLKTNLLFCIQITADCLAQEDQLLAHLRFQHTFLNDPLLQKKNNYLLCTRFVHVCMHVHVGQATVQLWRSEDNLFSLCGFQGNPRLFRLAVSAITHQVILLATVFNIYWKSYFPFSRTLRATAGLNRSTFKDGGGWNNLTLLFWSHHSHTHIVLIGHCVQQFLRSLKKSGLAR